MQQRQSSCLPCRTRKVKCDKKDPCTRCVKTNNNNCVYPSRGTLGRPPKNAVFHGKCKNNNVRQLAIREFIFEHSNGEQSRLNTKATAKAAGFAVNSEWWILSREALQEHRYLHTYFQTIHMFYIQRGLAIRKRFSTVTYRLLEKPRLKFSNLQLTFTWWTSMSVNVLLRRASKLRLETYSVPSLTLYMFQMNENENHDFLFNSRQPDNVVSTPAKKKKMSLRQPSSHNTQSQHKLSDPLKSLPSEQAINLIEDFFLVHPHSILVNKTQLINSYWSDTANPLLLSVIYGTTQCISSSLHGIHITLWESATEDNRNPFLAYSHSILETLPTTPSVSDYQATVILSLFEILWGNPKLGMSLLATSYLMGTQLGLWDNSFKTSDPVENELLNMTFWAAFRATTHGCMELGSNILDTMVDHGRVFPPINIQLSQSYHNDLLHHNANADNRAYLIESFYAGAVITHYSGIFYACLPKPYVNIFGLRTEDSTFQGSDLLTKLRAIEDVETRVQTALDDFYEFILQQRHLWSPMQRYTIETTYRLYRIHFRFLRPSLASGLRTYQEDFIPITNINGNEDKTSSSLASFVDPADPETATRLHQVQHELLTLVKDLDIILADSTHHSSNDNCCSSSLLPHGIMVTAFETSAQFLILTYQMDATCQHVRNAMENLVKLSKHRNLCLQSTTAIKSVRQRLKVFLKHHNYRLGVNDATKINEQAVIPSGPYVFHEEDLRYTDFGARNMFFLQPISHYPSSMTSSATFSSSQENNDTISVEMPSLQSHCLSQRFDTNGGIDNLLDWKNPVYFNWNDNSLSSTPMQSCEILSLQQGFGQNYEHVLPLLPNCRQ